MNAALLISRVGSQHGLSQSQIAERVGAHPDHIAAWSRGEDCPPDKHELLQRLAESKPEARDPDPR
jgi:DNA-binding transcriptional regulator YiaG